LCRPWCTTKQAIRTTARFSVSPFRLERYTISTYLYANMSELDDAANRPPHSRARSCSRALEIIQRECGYILKALNCSVITRYRLFVLSYVSGPNNVEDSAQLPESALPIRLSPMRREIISRDIAFVLTWPGVGIEVLSKSGRTLYIPLLSPKCMPSIVHNQWPIQFHSNYYQSVHFETLASTPVPPRVPTVATPVNLKKLVQ
jgi:hypothetical protein